MFAMDRGIMWPHKPHHYVKVGIPSVGEEKVTGHKMCVLCPQILSETFLILTAINLLAPEF
jgi:hypothetical protein